MASGVSTRVGNELFGFNTSLFYTPGSQQSSLGTAENGQQTRRFSWELSWKGQPRENLFPRSHQSCGQREGEAEPPSRKRCWMNRKLCPAERPLRAPAALQSWTQSHVLPSHSWWQLVSQIPVGATLSGISAALQRHREHTVLHKRTSCFRQTSELEFLPSKSSPWKGTFRSAFINSGVWFCFQETLWVATIRKIAGLAKFDWEFKWQHECFADNKIIYIFVL